MVGNVDPGLGATTLGWLRGLATGMERLLEKEDIFPLLYRGRDERAPPGNRGCAALGALMLISSARRADGAKLISMGICEVEVTAAFQVIYLSQ